MHPRNVLLVWLAAACGGGTMRVSPGESGNDTPVSLAPEPEGTPDSTLQSPADSTSSSQPVQDTARAQQGYAPYGDNESAIDLEIRRLGVWSHTGVREARRMVIQEANAWAEFWSELGVGDRPAVDFTQDIVIAVAAGERPSGGYEIAVNRVTQTNGELRVKVRETSPGPNCLSTSTLTQPVDVVVVQGVKPKSWSFVEQKDVRGCSP
ncbi:MAG: protease complex subunit PrcB family protein [Gemmatimonadales bacterium]